MIILKLISLCFLFFMVHAFVEDYEKATRIEYIAMDCVIIALIAICALTIIVGE